MMDPVDSYSEMPSPTDTLLAMREEATRINARLFADRTEDVRHEATIPVTPYESTHYYAIALITLLRLSLPTSSSSECLMRVQGADVFEPTGPIELLDRGMVGLGCNISQAIESHDRMPWHPGHTRTFAASYYADGKTFVTFGVQGGKNPLTRKKADNTVVSFVVGECQDTGLSLKLLPPAAEGERAMAEAYFRTLLTNHQPVRAYERQREQDGRSLFVKFIAA